MTQKHLANVSESGNFQLKKRQFIALEPALAFQNGMMDPQ
jgi:hypothetical protein